MDQAPTGNNLNAYAGLPIARGILQLFTISQLNFLCGYTYMRFKISFDSIYFSRFIFAVFNSPDVFLVKFEHLVVSL